MPDARLPSRYASPRLIARGGMAEIYLAADNVLGRSVAVKVLDERFSRDDQVRRRFKREALTQAKLSGHPHIVTIFDVGEHDGRPFMVMEYLPGGTVADRIRARSVTREETLEWLEQAAFALDEAHAAGVVHRDVKPANLLLDEHGNVHVGDFGIARVVDESTFGMTAAGTVLGTAGYLSPEQARGQRATAASDVYALGVVAYELLTGTRPFERRSATEEAAAHLHEPPPPASGHSAGLPRAVDDVLVRALAKHPADRYRDASDFVQALEDVLAPPEPMAVLPATEAVQPRLVERRPRYLPALLLGLLLAALAAGGVVAAVVTAGNDSNPQAEGGPRPQVSVMTVTQATTVQGEPTTIIQTTTEEAPAVAPPPEGEPASNGSGGASPSVAEATALNDRAFTQHMQQGDYAGALPLLEDAVPALRGTYSSGFQYEAYAEYNLGKTLAELGRCDEAVPHLERSEQLQGQRAPITAAKQSCGA
jgi:tRNA A-37 threonylcarbamoyl transferase component Bud32